MTQPAASIRLRLAQIQVYAGDPERNGQTILQAMAQAVADDIDLLVLPELCVPGYLVGDAWERQSFVRDCLGINAELIKATANTPLTLVFGSVAVTPERRGEDGRPRRYNAYYIAQDGRALPHPRLGYEFGSKTLLPNYREFDDSRYFFDVRKEAAERGSTWRQLLAPYALTLRGQSLNLGVVLCEDAWDQDYGLSPLAALREQGASLVLNLSASPYTQGKNAKRQRVFAARLKELDLPLAYVNCVGVQNNGKNFFAFDGASTAYRANGEPHSVAKTFAEDQLDLTFVPKTRQFVPPPSATPSAPAEPSPAAMTAEALTYALREILKQFGIGRVVIGASGGIDSAVAAALYAAVLPPESLLLANMPSRYNSRTTIGLAAQLAHNLGCYHATLAIEDSVKLTKQQVHGLSLRGANIPPMTLSLSSLAEENIQARDRGSRLLAALAAAFGGVFTCNANKAEMAVGYATLYGDHGGFLAALGDLWKHEVYALGRALNAKAGRPLIPEGIFSLPPSAELNSSQNVDLGQGDPLIYPYHDRLLWAFVQKWQRATPEDCLDWYLDGRLAAELGLPSEVDLQALFPTPHAFVKDLERWWELYTGMGAVKRVQSPPLIVQSSRAFGYDHREHLGPPPYTRAYRLARAKLLGTG